MSAVKYPPLRPTASDPLRVPPGFAVCDIESRKWIEFLIIGYYTKNYDYIKDGRKIVDREFLGEELQMFENMSEFIDWIFSDEQKQDTIIAHFGGKFDFQFILKDLFEMRDRYYITDIIPRSSGMLCFSACTMEWVKKAPKDEKLIILRKNGNFLIKKRTITFRDSSGMLAFSLDSLTDNFKVEHKKQKIDYSKIEKVTPELKEYLEYDLKGLYQVLEKYYENPLIKSSGIAYTAAGQALKIFQTYIDKPIPSLNSEVDAFVRRSYVGGRTEIFKPCFKQVKDNEILRTYDVNSLYPAVMLSNEYPMHFLYETSAYEADKMGFYEVDVEVPKMYIPPLGTIFDPNGWGRFIFPTGEIHGTWSTLELNYAKTLGVKIKKVYNGMIFSNGGYIFKDYISDVYGLRKKSDKKSADNIIYKLMMNSLYGRFGLQREREQIEFDHGQLGVDVHMEVKLKDDTYIRLMKKQISLDKTFSNVAIAAWVTSHARIRMHQFLMKNEENIYYMDTDSMYTTAKFDDSDLELGALKLEFTSKQACFILPKTYIADTNAPIWNLFDKEGKTYKSSKKIVMKGFDKKKISQFTMEDFYVFLEGEMRLKTTNPEKFATFKTAAAKNKFLMLLKESPREIRSRYDKRKIIKRHYAQIWDTEPLHIENGVITNMTIKRRKSESKKENTEEISPGVMQKFSENGYDNLSGRLS